MTTQNTDTNFLPQTPSVQLLIDLLNQSEPMKAEADFQKSLVSLVKVFTIEQTLCSLSMVDFMNKASENGIELNTNDAKQLMADIAVDVGQHYLEESIKRHLNIYKEMKRRHKKHLEGAIINMQPDACDPVNYSHFDCWNDGDETDADVYEWGSKEAKEIALTMLGQAMKDLDCLLVVFMIRFKDGVFETRKQFFDALAAEYIKQDFYVYHSPEMFEVYKGSSIREYHSAEEIAEMIEV